MATFEEVSIDDDGLSSLPDKVRHDSLGRHVILKCWRAGRAGLGRAGQGRTSQPRCNE